MTAAMGTTKPRLGFTMVEMMMVIVIIGILMAIAIPAIFNAVTTGRQTALKMEVDALSQAVEQYMQKYGDYPPDGSSEAVLNRHMRRLFPRMADPDLTLLKKLTDAEPTNTLGSFSSVAMDRAEALVFFLGGFSDDPLHPLTGESGPIKLSSNPVDSDNTNILNYEYNATRDNSFFDFDLSRLTVARASDSASLLSTDESTLQSSTALFGGADPLPVYLAGGAEPTPILYFDSRTYGSIGGAYNGFGTASYGRVRPYKSGRNISPPPSGGYASLDAAFAAIPFHNPSTYQIISPGLDGIYGSIVSVNPADAAATPVHFVTETGQAVYPVSGATATSQLFFTTSPIAARFQDLGWVSGIAVNGHLDNITNFSSSTLESDLE